MTLPAGGRSQFPATTCTSGIQNFTTALSSHSLSKSVAGVLTLFTWLICAFHETTFTLTFLQEKFRSKKNENFLTVDYQLNLQPKPYLP